MAKEIRSYRDLDAWQVTIRLTERVYQSVIRLPATERFRLSAQMRRALAVTARLSRPYFAGTASVSR